MTTPSSNSAPLSEPAADLALEAGLRALTTYTDEPTVLWRSALQTHDAARAKTRSRLSMMITVVSAAAVLLLAVGVFLPSLGNARFAARSSVGSVAMDGLAAPAAHVPGYQDVEKDGQAAESARWKAVEAFKKIDGAFEKVPVDNPAAQPGTSEPAGDSPARSVIRKATIELAVPSTRESFAKCQHLLRLDLGEFVEGSSLTGQAEDARGQLTLRIAATRLDEVLNALRAMGKVDSENATGDDVTAQVVDLDARLRNERTVETEILKLLESRRDAQLKDILDLRDKLASIRSGIEQLQGRRDTLGRQISLASVLVLLRPDNAPKPEPKPASILDGFSHEMTAAWTSGLTTLTQTISFFVRILVGGLIWWLLLIGALAIARRALRRWLPDPAAVPTSA